MNPAKALADVRKLENRFHQQVATDRTDATNGSLPIRVCHEKAQRGSGLPFTRSQRPWALRRVDWQEGFFW